MISLLSNAAKYRAERTASPFANRYGKARNFSSGGNKKQKKFGDAEESWGFKLPKTSAKTRKHPLDITSNPRFCRIVDKKTVDFSAISGSKRHSIGEKSLWGLKSNTLTPRHGHPKVHLVRLPFFVKSEGT